MLGPDYLMHPHRVLHDNPPGSDLIVWANSHGASPIVVSDVGDAPPAYGNPGYRRLISNALKFTPRGTVAARCSSGWSWRENVTVTVSLTRSYCSQVWRGSWTSRFASFTASIASLPQPSAPHSLAHSGEVGAPPIKILTLLRWPAFSAWSTPG